MRRFRCQSIRTDEHQRSEGKKFKPALSIAKFKPALSITTDQMKIRIAVIGAGAAGLLAARKCLEDGSFDVTVFEQGASVGGTWVYSPETNVHSSLYETMSTNLPKEVMFFPGVPFDPEANVESFVPHQDVRSYLEDYAVDVKPVIKFNHKVIKIERIDETWNVTTKSKADPPKTDSFDVVFVCNGHYADQNYPVLRHAFSGRSLHSHNYRRASEYRGETVAIVGAGNSGMDISLQVATEAKKVYLLHRKAPKYTVLHENIEERNALSDFSENGKDLILEDDAVIQNVDTVIFCTGYSYTFPFFGEKIVQLRKRGTLVEPLYLHMVHKDFPTSLFFFGIPYNLIPFVLFDYQARFALSIIHGTADLDVEEMEKFEERRGVVLRQKFGSRKECHFMGMAQWDLFHTYAKLGGFEYDTPQRVRDLYESTVEERAKNVTTYKKRRFSEY